jgi:RNA polymerase sigma factor (sigma-70 family)
MQPTNAHATGEQRPEVSLGPENARQFDDVLSRCLPSFHRLAFRKLGNAADAEDAVQDALLSAYKHLDQFNGAAQMSTWLTTIVINSARMQLRRRSRHIQVSLDEQFGDEQECLVSERIVDDGPSPEDVCRESELHDRVRGLLTQLSAPLRKAFQLRDLNGLNTREAALILGVPDGTVKAQLARARAKLRQLINRSPDAGRGSAVTHAPRSMTTMKREPAYTRETTTTCNGDLGARPKRKVVFEQIRESAAVAAEAAA